MKEKGAGVGTGDKGEADVAEEGKCDGGEREG